MTLAEEKAMLEQSIQECIEVQHKIANIKGITYANAISAIKFVSNNRKEMEKRLKVINKSQGGN